MHRHDYPKRLRQAGLRVTRPRLLVLELLGETRNHLSVDELVDRLDSQGTPLLRGSVYGVVEALQECSLVTQAELGAGPARYELNRQEPHCHFICSICGGVQDVALDQALRVELPVSGLVDQVQLVLRGRCGECLQLETPA